MVFCEIHSLYFVYASHKIHRRNVKYSVFFTRTEVGGLCRFPFSGSDFVFWKGS